MYLGGTDDGNPEVVLQEVLQRKTFFTQNNLYKNLLGMQYPLEKLFYF